MGLAAAATSNGFIYAIGGLATNSVFLNSVEVFDIAANSWTPRSAIAAGGHRLARRGRESQWTDLRCTLGVDVLRSA